MNLESLISSVIAAFISGYIGFRAGKKEKTITIVSEGKDNWIDIKKHPIPGRDNIESFDYILATDGRLVKSIYRAHPEYNSKGEQVLSSYGYQKPITHWMPYPTAPK